jgi:integrase
MNVIAHIPSPVNRSRDRPRKLPPPTVRAESRSLRCSQSARPRSLSAGIFRRDSLTGSCSTNYLTIGGRSTANRLAAASTTTLPRVRERFRRKRARDIQLDHMEAFLKDLEHEQLAASTINKYRTILCSTFNFAIRREKFGRNPVSIVPQRKEPPGRDRFLPPEDFRKLIDECRAEPALCAPVRRICISGRPVQRPLQRDAGARLGHAQALPCCVRTCWYKEPRDS